MNSTTIERIMYYLACACMLLIAINHTAYSKGAYHMTWVLCGVVCMCSMLALRPKYRTTCWNAVKYGTAAVLPLVAVAGVVALGVWFVQHPGWFVVVGLGGPVLWAIWLVSDMQSRPPHHDSRPDSHYRLSQRKKWDNSK